MAESRYFELPPTSESAGLLLRERDHLSEKFAEGRWQRTTLLVDYFFGEATSVEPISEQQAMTDYPEAFA